jgi:hypothetical protein
MSINTIPIEIEKNNWIWKWWKWILEIRSISF